MKEVGIGIKIGTFGSGITQQVQSMITTQNFGAAADAAAITGVAYADDIVPDDFYSLGEGMANVSVIATSENGLRYETKTNSAGGYSLRLPPGSYMVIANNTAGEVAEIGEVTVADRNIKLDLTEELFRWNYHHTTTNNNQTREPHLDLSGDGLVSALDVLLVVNHINQFCLYDSRLDTNGDGTGRALDALLVNYLNQQAQVSVEPDQVEYCPVLRI
ncbi:MAG: dockerin type I domain-containing protein [Pirellulaceae bacterium]